MKPLPSWTYAFFILNCLVILGLLTMGQWWLAILDVLLHTGVGIWCVINGYDI